MKIVLALLVLTCTSSSTHTMQARAFQIVRSRSRASSLSGVSGVSLYRGGQRQRQRHVNVYPRAATVLFSTKGKDNDSNNDDDDEMEIVMKQPKGQGKGKGQRPRPKPKSKKIKLRDPSDFNLDALTAEFDKMAKKEGFDDSASTVSVFRADDATFEADFDYDNMDDDMDDDMEFEDDDDDFLDFGGGTGAGMSMEERINAAKRDSIAGTITVPDEMEAFSKEVTAEDLQKLGFQKETNPFGNDESRRNDKKNEVFTLIQDAMTCPACGSKFQTNDEFKPGFLPQQKYEIQTKLAQIEQVQSLQQKAESEDWSPEDEVEWLLQSGSAFTSTDDDEIDINAMAHDLGLDLEKLAEKKVICKRCHGLQNFGEAPEMLRPGWTDEPSLSQEKFRDLLLPLREKPAVIVALVDLFDFSGSILPDLDAIAGENPVIIAANKVDLMPSKMGQNRIESWVRRELEYMGIQSIANIGGAVRLVSCQTGFGVSQMLAKARQLADEMESDIYVVGAANAGKSTLINHILEKNDAKTKKAPVGKKRAGNANKRKGAVTASPLPGTTLEFIKIDIGDGVKLYDTPGLLVPGTLTQRLTPAELKMVVPKKQVEPVTFRVSSGKCVLIGGLARIEVIGDTKPFLFTFYVSNDIKLHPTSSDKADEFIQKHAGEMLTPPLDPGPERMEQIGEFEYHDVEIEGAGWKEAGADISLRGIGWVAVTGAGAAKVRIGVPKGIGFSVRPPLMPFDVWEATAKYTGGKATRKSTKTKTGKRNKGVGRR